jgi:putative hydrolase of HD superfamily
MDKYDNILDFYLLATKLKTVVRSGWNENHWNIKAERLESIAEHVYGTCILAIAINSEFPHNIDINKVIKMLVLHEIGEAIIGDITPTDGITPEEKERMEHEAMAEVLSSLEEKDELLKLLLEFDAHETNESIFAARIDKMEADIQAKIYQEMGLYDQEYWNEFIDKTPRLKKLHEEGVENKMFNYWYIYDRAILGNDEAFLGLQDKLKDEEVLKRKREKNER